MSGIVFARFSHFVPIPKEETMPGTLESLTPREAQERLGTGALLVCAYDDDGKFEKNRLEGAMSLRTLREREESMSKDKELIFYCA
jgi:rhodanese-related sulfurtransferase